MNNKKMEKTVVSEREQPVMAGEREGAESVPSQEKGKHLFQPGQVANPNGRPKGAVNKVTKTIREAVLEAVQPGACHKEGLTGWLKDRALGGIEDRKIFAGMVSRVIPVEITGTGGGPIKIDLGWMTDRRLVTGDVIDVTPTSQNDGNALLSAGATDSISVDKEE